LDAEVFFVQAPNPTPHLIRPDRVGRLLGEAGGLVVVVHGVLKRHGRHWSHIGAQHPAEKKIAQRMKTDYFSPEIL
jgi:hypothetical protein